MHTVVNGPVYWFREKVAGMRTGEVSIVLDWSTVMYRAELRRMKNLQFGPPEDLTKRPHLVFI